MASKINDSKTLTLCLVKVVSKISDSTIKKLCVEGSTNKTHTVWDNEKINHTLIAHVAWHKETTIFQRSIIIVILFLLWV